MLNWFKKSNIKRLKFHDSELEKHDLKWKDQTFLYSKEKSYTNLVGGKSGLGMLYISIYYWLANDWTIELCYNGETNEVKNAKYNVNNLEQLPSNIYSLVEELVEHCNQMLINYKMDKENRASLDRKEIENLFVPSANNLTHPNKIIRDLASKRSDKLYVAALNKLEKQD